MTGTRALLDEAAARLAAAGVDTARIDAELLLAHVLAVPRPRLVLMPDLDELATAEFAAAVERRSAREPLQHIVGTAPFRYLELAVGPGVFVPRPETELLVDAVLPELTALAAPVVVDLCAGSGALALAIAREVPNATVVAVESAPEALPWLHRNAAGTGVQVVAADIREPGLLADRRRRVDVVVSNPPYVPESTAVQDEVRADPHDAVFAGTDGLALLPAVVALAEVLLRADGLLAVEHDDSHAEAVPALLRAGTDWTSVEDHRDLSGRPRYATARRVAAPRTAR